jgi:hypothetical protein
MFYPQPLDALYPARGTIFASYCRLNIIVYGRLG